MVTSTQIYLEITRNRLLYTEKPGQPVVFQGPDFYRLKHSPPYLKYRLFREAKEITTASQWSGHRQSTLVRGTSARGNTHTLLNFTVSSLLARALKADLCGLALERLVTHYSWRHWQVFNLWLYWFLYHSVFSSFWLVTQRVSTESLSEETSKMLPDLAKKLMRASVSQLL